MSTKHIASKILGKFQSEFARYTTKLKALKYNEFVIDSESPQDLHFAFFGEFGYSLLAWIPYLKFLKEKTPHRIHTHGGNGSTSFYNFSDSHKEHDSKYYEHTHGNLNKYIKLEKKVGKKLIFPSNQTQRVIRINGFEWENKKDRSDIKTNTYSPLSHATHPLPNEISKPFVVVNNKNYYNWGNSAIVNFFKNIELYKIAEQLNSTGLTLIYNEFPDGLDEENQYVDNLVDFKDCSNVFDLRETYKNITDPNERNRLQLSLYQNSKFVIAVQGGNAVLPLTCKKDTYILMRGGFDYPFYKSLEKIYGCQSECFYEPEHLIQHIAKR